MTKNERIENLERRVAELEAQLSDNCRTLKVIYKLDDAVQTYWYLPPLSTANDIYRERTIS